MRSSWSTTSMRTGRSSDNRRMRVVWRWALAPNPSIPRMTVAPAIPRSRRNVDDRLVERLAVVVVGLADVDPDQQRLSLDAHQIARPMARPASDRHEPETTDPPRLAIGRRRMSRSR